MVQPIESPFGGWTQAELRRLPRFPHRESFAAAKGLISTFLEEGGFPYRDLRIALFWLGFGLLDMPTEDEPTMGLVPLCKDLDTYADTALELGYDPKGSVHVRPVCSQADQRPALAGEPAPPRPPTAPGPPSLMRGGSSGSSSSAAGTGAAGSSGLGQVQRHASGFSVAPARLQSGAGATTEAPPPLRAHSEAPPVPLYDAGGEEAATPRGRRRRSGERPGRRGGSVQDLPGAALEDAAPEGEGPPEHRRDCVLGAGSGRVKEMPPYYSLKARAWVGDEADEEAPSQGDEDGETADGYPSAYCGAISHQGGAVGGGAASSRADWYCRGMVASGHAATGGPGRVVAEGSQAVSCKVKLLHAGGWSSSSGSEGHRTPPTPAGGRGSSSAPLPGPAGEADGGGLGADHVDQFTVSFVSDLQLHEDLEETSLLCTFCLDEMQIGEELCRLPCMHTFHRGCVHAWLARDRRCMLCRLDVTRPRG